MITAAPMMLQLSAAPAETAPVERTLDAMHAAASVADGEAYFATFTPDARFIGTDAAGLWVETEDGWKIEQYVLSFAVPNDKARAVVDAIKAD